MATDLTPEEREALRVLAWKILRVVYVRIEDDSPCIEFVRAALSAVPRLGREEGERVEVEACRSCAMVEGIESTRTGECPKCGSDDWVYVEGFPTGYRLAAPLAAREEGERDTARLDWLDEYARDGVWLDVFVYGDSTTIEPYNDNMTLGFGPNVRAAIDSAMESVAPLAAREDSDGK